MKRCAISFHPQPVENLPFPGAFHRFNPLGRETVETVRVVDT